MNKTLFRLVWCTFLLFSSLLSLHAEDFWQDTLWTRKLPLGGHVFAEIKFHPDGKTIFAASDQYLFRYDVQTGALLKTYEMKSKAYIHDYIFTKDAKRVVIGCDRYSELNRVHNIEVWDLDTGLVWQKAYDTAAEIEGIASIRLSHDEKILYVGNAVLSGQLYIIDYVSGELLETKKGVGGGIDISPDGRYMVCSYFLDGSTVFNSIVEISTWKRIRTLPQYYDPKYDPTGRYIVMRDKDILLYEVETQKSYSLKGHKGQVSDACFSFDGKYVLSCSRNEPFENNGYRIWDVISHKLLYAAPPYFNGSGIVSSPLKNTIVIGGKTSPRFFAIKSPAIISNVGDELPFSNTACMSITPNPSHDFLTIIFNQKNNLSNVSIHILNIKGEIVLTKEYSESDNNTINIRHLPSGNYIVKLTQANVSICSAPFIINR